MQIESLVSSIENTLYGRGEAEIESTEVGELIMQGLAELSEVAYVRFASVYRRFSDVTGFENELEELRTKQKTSKK